MPLPQGLLNAAKSIGSDIKTGVRGIGSDIGAGARAIGTGASALGSGAKSFAARLGQQAAVPLTHFTTEAGDAGIMSSKALRGREGIFALPSTAKDQTPLMRAIRSGVKPSGLTNPIDIPDAARKHFEGVFPVGPYSGWKALGGVRMAPPGSIHPTTGAFTPSGSIWKTRALMYGPDAALGGAGLASAMWAKNKRDQEEQQAQGQQQVGGQQ